MSQPRVLSSSLRWKVGGILVCTFLLTGWIVWQYLLPPSPEKVFAQTVRALETGDTALLMRYADPDEMKRLNLTQANVDVFLRETIWYDGYPKLVYNSMNPPRRDLRGWTFKNINKKAKYDSIQIVVMDDLKNGWTLGVTQVLWHSAMSRYGYPAGRREFWKLNNRLGILGRKDRDHYVEYDSKLEAEIAERTR